MSSKFYWFSKTLAPPPVLKGHNHAGLNTKQSYMKAHILFYIAFKVLKVGTSQIFFTMQTPVLLVLVILHQFLHQQMLYFKTSLNTI